MLKLTRGEFLEMGEKEELKRESKSRSQSTYKGAALSEFLLAQDMVISSSNYTNNSAYGNSSDEELIELPFPALIIQGQFEELGDSFVFINSLPASQAAEGDKDEDKGKDNGGEISDEVISDNDKTYEDAVDIWDDYKFKNKDDENNEYNANYYDYYHADNTKEGGDYYGEDDKDHKTKHDIYCDGIKDIWNLDDYEKICALLCPDYNEYCRDLNDVYETGKNKEKA